ncbi:MAG: hypothetical protein AAGL10_06695 [Pseudomonadota bacterium]
MPMILKAILWALAVILVALLGATGLLPEPVAKFLTIGLPALSAAVLILPGLAQGCRKGKRT